ncbi:hypothetical protein AVEN_143226-1 [Araneus ventricosus]|uniref:Uncharacterized protein n=1 Tax=Araneus ventricosus TaxID=182803 RepID=A0A4Y2ADV9_ARAVE|nr:hypothetical protein AVEN_143226-1 [Araneus ventricosus]
MTNWWFHVEHLPLPRKSSGYTLGICFVTLKSGNAFSLIGMIERRHSRHEARRAVKWAKGASGHDARGNKTGEDHPLPWSFVPSAMQRRLSIFEFVCSVQLQHHCRRCHCEVKRKSINDAQWLPDLRPSFVPTVKSKSNCLSSESLFYNTR